jgi:NAD(P)-dependent dehydrogenase (short-subunit alcohol dehydrogenase family)
MTKAPDFSVDGRSVLISGGTGGLGFACAEAFAAAGADVLVTDIKPPRDPLPDRIAFEQVDVADAAAIARVAAGYDRLDVLLYLAGQSLAPHEYEIENFQLVMDTHVTGAVRFVNAFDGALRAARGTIILTSSVYAFVGAQKGAAAYSAAKAATINLAKSLARRFAGSGVRANAMAPGWYATPLTEGLSDNAEFTAGLFRDRAIDRWLEPAEYAGTAVFLGSEAARAINGVTIPVDGGYLAG